MQYTEWATHQIFFVPDLSQPYFIFYCKLSKITLEFIGELMNLKYSFNIPFKITLKTIIMGTSSQFHNGVQLNILLLALRCYVWIEFKALWRPGVPIKKIMENLMYNLPNLLRLTLIQCGKAFGYPHYIAIDWRAFSRH